MKSIILFAVVYAIAALPIFLHGRAWRRGVEKILGRKVIFETPKQLPIVVQIAVLPLASVALLVPAFARTVASSLVDDVIVHPDNKVTIAETLRLRAWIDSEW